MLIVLILIIIAIVTAVGGVKNHRRYYQTKQIEDFMRCHFFYTTCLICSVGAILLSAILSS